MNENYGALSGAQDIQSAPTLDPFVDQSDEERELAHRIEKDIGKAMSKVLAFRQEAKGAEGAYDGHQWDDLDRMRLEQLRRPVLTFNEIKPTINAISGIERLNRYDMRFVARPLDSQPQLDMKGDLASEAYATVLDMCDGDMERSTAIRDMSITGMGWMEVFMDYSLDADGRIQVKRRPWKEMLWDTAAREANLNDSRWRARKRDMERAEFKKRWPKWLEMVDVGTPHYEEQNVTKYELVTPYYSLANEKANPTVGEQGTPKSTIPVVQYQWRETEPVYRFADPSVPNGIQEMREKDWRKLRKRLVALGATVPDAVRQLRTVHYQAFEARGVLLEGPTELPGGFSLKCYTGEYDDQLGIWYGIVRPLLDPQKTMNKSLATALTMFLSNAKGGVMYETGTFVDPWLAKDQWAKTDAWIEVNEGKLASGVVQRQPMKFDGSIDLFFNESKQAMSYVSGLPADMLAQAGQEANAPTISRRIQAGMGVLGWYFDNINRGRKEEARTVLEYIREFWSQGQFIRVGGNANSPAIPLLKGNLPDQYDLMLDESVRHNPNLKAQVWQDLQPIIPALLKFGLGRFLLQALKFSPLPAQLVSEMQKEAMQMMQQGGGQGGQQQKGRGKQESPELVKAKVGKMSAETQRIIAQAKKIDTETKLRPIEMVMDNVHKVGQGKQKTQIEQMRARLQQSKQSDQAEQADMSHKHKVLDTVLRSMSAFLGHGLEVDKAAHEAVQLARYDKGDE